MPKTSFRVHTVINAAPETVFGYVADLSKHSEWAANPLQIERISAGPIAIGSRYRSTAQVNSINFMAELQVNTYEPPTRFGFAGEDRTGRFEHQFAFRPSNMGTWLERRVNFELTLQQWLMFAALLYPVRLPAAKTALRLLKARLERGE